ncbi:MAG: radical SAM family heme chaperone HemW [Candidatus Desulfofervidaceae bacterium]|nr:radical SAM family heme chaperone HemW [Candidatus Desulfofervidaceae bacterium]
MSQNNPIWVEGIYIHVPFCLSKCPYCDFYSEIIDKRAEEYGAFLLQELNLNQNIIWNKPTVYFGGGTPSLMPPSFFASILRNIENYSEVSLEANPASFNRTFLKEVKQIGINRFNLGIQTLQPCLLQLLERPYTKEAALAALEWTCVEFDNVGVDIIFGIPGQTLADIYADLNVIAQFPIKHISAYLLTFYPGTPFYKRLKAKKIQPLPEEVQREMYFTIKEFLEARGFIHYEISNFARSGYFCKHNLLYWQLKNYLGLGAGAASLLNFTYRVNIKDVDTYYYCLSLHKLPIDEKEIWSLKEFKAISLIMGLRLLQGVHLERLGLINQWEIVQEDPAIQALLEENLLVFDSPYLRLSKRALFISDAVTNIVVNAFLYVNSSSEEKNR